MDVNVIAAHQQELAANVVRLPKLLQGAQCCLWIRCARRAQRNRHTSDASHKGRQGALVSIPARHAGREDYRRVRGAACDRDLWPCGQVVSMMTIRLHSISSDDA